MNFVDRWILGAATVAVAGGLAWGAMSASSTSPAASAGARAGRATGGNSARAPVKVDPLRPPGLPRGVTIDPATGKMVGLRLDAPPGTSALPWELIKSYEYQKDLAGLPADLSTLAGKKVVMAGVLMPLYEFDDIHEFALVESHWSCCYGNPPGLNGVVYVKLKDGADGLPNTAEPIRVIGTFEAKERKESGFILSIYAITDAEVTVVGY